MEKTFRQRMIRRGTLLCSVLIVFFFVTVIVAPPAYNLPSLTSPTHAGSVGKVSVAPYRLGGWKLSYLPVLGVHAYSVSTGSGKRIVTEDVSGVYVEDNTEGPFVPLPSMTVQPLGSHGSAYGSPSTVTACPDYLFLSVRGSGQNTNTSGYGEQLGDRGLRLVNQLRENLGVGKSTIASYGIPYPANSVDNMTGWAAYQTSERAGETTLRQVTQDVSSVCPAVCYIMFGYSQGADVVGSAWGQLPDNIKNSTVAVILFADPKYNPSDTSSRGERVNQGMLGQRTPYNDPKIQSWCYHNDTVCSSTVTQLLDISEHVHGTTYDRWETEQAQRLANNLRGTFSQK